MLAFIIALAVLAVDPATTQKDFEAARDAYDKEVARTKQAVSEEHAMMQKKYLGKLEAIRTGFATAGDKLRAFAVKAEMDRVRAAPAGDSPSPTPAGPLVELKMPTGDWHTRADDLGIRTFAFDGNSAKYKGFKGVESVAFRLEKGYLIGQSTDGYTIRWTPCVDGRFLMEYFKAGATVPSNMAFAWPAGDMRF